MVALPLASCSHPPGAERFPIRAARCRATVGVTAMPRATAIPRAARPSLAAAVALLPTSYKVTAPAAYCNDNALSPLRG